MELIIDIPEEVYHNIKIGNTRSYSIRNIAIYAIENGIQLPKGHGRLGDLDRLSKKFIKKDVDAFKGSFEALAGWFLRACKNEDTIIKADKESEVNNG